MAPAEVRSEHRPSSPKVAVVTGASSGIGKATAHALSRRGWHVVLLARREERLRALAEELGGEYELCDVSRREDVRRAAAAVIERHPRIRLLVNNAGIPGRTGFTTITAERLEELLRVNYLGSVWCLRAFLPALEGAGRSHVVNIVSVAGALALVPAGPYSASKHAQLAFSRAAAGELRPERVAQHVLESIDRDRGESFVPRWYRAAAVAQALAPRVVARLGVRLAERGV
jgi:NAD(P)-dependent dehydrogenase (short-subunit alcohol dehydrogenase family)